MKDVLKEDILSHPNVWVKIFLRDKELSVESNIFYWTKVPILYREV